LDFNTGLTHMSFGYDHPSPSLVCCKYGPWSYHQSLGCFYLQPSCNKRI